jgi:hypothetical protein
MSVFSIKKHFFLLFIILSSKNALSYDFSYIFCNDGSNNQADGFLVNLQTSCLPHQSKDSITESVIKNILINFRYHAKNLKNEKTSNIHNTSINRISDFINKIACPGAELKQNVILEENILNACKENIISINCENGRTLYSLKDGTVLSIPSKGAYSNEIKLQKMTKEENCIKYKSVVNRVLIRGAKKAGVMIIKGLKNTTPGPKNPQKGPPIIEPTPHHDTEQESPYPED